MTGETLLPFNMAATSTAIQILSNLIGPNFDIIGCIDIKLQNGIRNYVFYLLKKKFLEIT